MNEPSSWTDESREDLRETLRSAILGELRLTRLSQDEILEHCCEAYIDEDCPEEQRDQFVQFASEELQLAARRLSAEMQRWPRETDCDRLDRAASAMRERGILLWQVSPCCDTCTYGELPDRFDWAADRYRGFRERARGYAFFIDQNMPEMLADSTYITVYLAYGCHSWQDPAEEAGADEGAKSLAIGHEVCGCLRDAGLDVTWEGDLSRKIGLSLNWQRRTPLE